MQVLYRMFAMAPLWLLAGGTAHGQSADVFDATRLHVTLGSHVAFGLPGDARLVYGHLSPIAITAEDDQVADAIEAENFGFVRLRLQPTLVATGAGWAPFQLYKAAADIDVLRHLAFVGDGREVLRVDEASRSETGLVGGGRLNQAYVLAAGRHLALKAGLTRSSWGTGMLANGGDFAGPGVARSPFGFAIGGDRVARLQVAFFPLRPSAKEQSGAPVRPLTIVLGADAVVDDDLADWAAGDRAYQAVAAVRGQSRDLGLGVYVVHRRQEHAEGGNTNATVIDVHLMTHLARGPNLDAWLELEGAAILGETSFSRSATLPGPFEITSMGGVLRFGIGSGDFDIVLEAGGASGDDNPFDDELHQFAFDDEYRVGLLMFSEALRTASAVTAYNIADPTFRGRPPRGFDQLATGGAVAGAAYVNPRLAWQPSEGLTLAAGLVFGVSDTDYTDAYRSGLQGGAPVGPNGARGVDDLGTEIDFGVRWEAPLHGPARLTLRAEFAWMDPGEVFDKADGTGIDDIVGAWVNAGVSW